MDGDDGEMVVGFCVKKGSGSPERKLLFLLTWKFHHLLFILLFFFSTSIRTHSRCKKAVFLGLPPRASWPWKPDASYGPLEVNQKDFESLIDRLTWHLCHAMLPSNQFISSHIPPLLWSSTLIALQLKEVQRTIPFHWVSPYWFAFSNVYCGLCCCVFSSSPGSVVEFH